MARPGDGSAGRSRLALLVAGLVLLGLSWLVATEPFGAPDEPAHYLRALNLANGHLLGPKARWTTNAPSQAAIAFVQANTRAVLVPARMAPPEINCISGKPNTQGSCLEPSYEGNFPPLPYVLPAVALKASRDTSTALWLSRLASDLQSLAFLVLAACLLWRGTTWSLLGLVVTTTPMVLFVSSVLNPSGVEIASGIAFAAGALRIASAPADVPRWCWTAFIVAGVVLIVSWPLGLAFALADLALLGALLEPGGLHQLRESSRRALKASAVALLAAVAIWLVYGHVSGLDSGHIAVSSLLPGLHLGVGQLSPVLRDAVGTFGSLTVSLPLGAYYAWWALVVGLVAAALWLGTVRERVALTAVTAAALSFPVVFYAVFTRSSGFGLQGRELLPLLVVIPLSAGEVVYRHRDPLTGRRPARGALVAVLLLTAVFQGYAWWVSARVAARAPGTIRFYAHAAWVPPLGWLPWLGLAGLGTLALLMTGLAEATHWDMRLLARLPREQLERPSKP